MRDPSRWRKALRDEQPEDRVAEMWHQIKTRRRPEEEDVVAERVFRRQCPRWLSPAVSPAIRSALVGAALVLVCVAAWGVIPKSEVSYLESDVLRLAGAPLPARLSPATTHVFSDASRVTTEAETALEVLESNSQAVTLALRHGVASFSVTPGGPRTWRVAAGGVMVEVTGTVFEVRRTERTVSISVQRGSVVVRGAGVSGEVQRLVAGGVLVVPDLIVTPDVEAEVASPTLPAEPDELGESVTDAQPSEPRFAGPRQVLSLSDAPVQVDALLARADALRLSGQPAKAAVALEAVVRGHPGDSRTALAAYSLARLRLEVLHQPSRAANHFQQSLALGLSGPLREAARAGQVVALGQAGKTARARLMAQRYLAAYPAGRYRAEVEVWR